jgi:hypothetical protein
MKNIITFIAITMLMSCGNGNAPEAAEVYAAKHYPGNTGTECISGMDADSDDDGYISCTVFLPDNKAIPIECASSHYGCMSKSGCRMATGKSSNRRRGN